MNPEPKFMAYAFARLTAGDAAFGWMAFQLVYAPIRAVGMSESAATSADSKRTRTEMHGELIWVRGEIILNYLMNSNLPSQHII
jgi:hypothetical protein